VEKEQYNEKMKIWITTIGVLFDALFVIINERDNGA
jgi:hypothetical protein